MQDTRSLTSTNLHARDLHQRPSRRSHSPVCMLVTSIVNMSTGVTTKHLRTVRAWTPGQHQTTLDYCVTQRKHPASLINGTSAPIQTWPLRVSARTADCRTDVFPTSQHRPSLITPPKLKVPAHSDPVKRWNFRKADWKRFCLLTDESVERLLPPDTSNIERACQDFCESLLSAAKQ